MTSSKSQNKRSKIFRSGFISIVGRANVGKSTLLNTILAKKIAITSNKPQTTRNRINGIKTSTNGQIIFIDTPGIHSREDKINRLMVEASVSTFKEADLILFMTDPFLKAKEEDREIINSILKDFKGGLFLLINKTDLLKSKEGILTAIDYYSRIFPFKEIFPISALDKEDTSMIEEKIIEYLPEGPKYFPDDMLTDQPDFFHISEIIREKITILTKQELPYTVAVAVKNITDKEKISVIEAEIFVAKDSQKGILIGKNGSMLKDIGRRSREDIEKFLNKRVYLELHIKVREGWTTNDTMLKRFGVGVRE